MRNVANKDHHPLSCLCENRRGALKTFGALSFMASGASVWADTKEKSNKEHYRIDTHHHFYPPEIGRAHV